MSFYYGTYMSLFSIRVFLRGHWWLTGHQGNRGNHLYSSLPLQPANEHSDFYLQLYMWDDCHIFVIAPLVFTRLLFCLWDLPPYQITMSLIDDVMLIFVCLLDGLIPGYITAIWHGKPGNSNSHQPSPLYYKRTD